jgi:hypothetical protein
MKTKLLFLTVTALLLFFAGCHNDQFFGDDSNADLDLKKANVPIPSKGEICMISSDDRLDVHFGSSTGPVTGIDDLSRTAFLYGHMTHIGNLNEQSFMTGREGAYLDAVAYSQGKIVIVAIYDAHIITANGDSFDVVSYITIDATDPDNKIIAGTTSVTGGTGKFENATGEGTLNGVLPCWDVDGNLKFE